VGVRLRTDRQTDTQTHTQTRVTTIHFASSTTHAKCNNNINIILGTTHLPLTSRPIKRHSYSHSNALEVEIRIQRMTSFVSSLLVFESRITYLCEPDVPSSSVASRASAFSHIFFQRGGTEHLLSSDIRERN